MINRIIKPRAAILAFAAIALFTTPAYAERGDRNHNRHNQNGVSITVSTDLAGNYNTRHNSRHNARHHNQYGDRFTRREQRQMRRQAIRACRQGIRYDVSQTRFRNAHFGEVHNVERIGPRGYRVTVHTHIDGRRRSFDRDVTCTVRRGELRRIEGLDLPRRRNRGRGHNYHW